MISPFLEISVNNTFPNDWELTFKLGECNIRMFKPSCIA